MTNGIVTFEDIRDANGAHVKAGDFVTIVQPNGTATGLWRVEAVSNNGLMWIGKDRMKVQPTRVRRTNADHGAACEGCRRANNA